MLIWNKPKPKRKLKSQNMNTHNNNSKYFLLISFRFHRQNIFALYRGAEQVINQENGEVVYTLRINGTSFQPWVFKNGIYRVDVGELGTNRVRLLEILELEGWLMGVIL